MQPDGLDEVALEYMAFCAEQRGISVLAFADLLRGSSELRRDTLLLGAAEIPTLLNMPPAIDECSDAPWPSS